MERVLQVLPRLRRGGSQMMVMNLYRSINREKVQFDFVIFTQDHDAFYDEITSMGGKVYSLPRFNGKNYFSYKKAWKVFFKNHPEYKIIHSHYRSCASIYFKIAKKFGLKTIIHSHSTSNGKGISAFLKNMLQRPLRKQADYLFACSDLAGEWLFGKKATALPNYKFVPNGIDINRFLFDKTARAKTRKDFGISEDCFVIGHIGRFSKMKNHVFLFNIFEEYHKKNKNSKLLLVGIGECEQEIREMAQKHELIEDVVFAGLQERTETFYDAMDVFVFPSIWEGFPVSVLEAQTSGLICLISDTITKDVKITKRINYFSLDELDDWVTFLNSLTANEYLNRAVGELEMKKLMPFDSKNVAKELECFYLSIIDNYGK